MTRHLTLSELRRLRLVSQGLVRATPARTGSAATEVLDHMLALQGQDLPGVLWSLGQRVEGADVTEVRGAFDSGDLVRSWPFRGTLHVLRARDLPWVLGLTAPRTLSGSARRREELGLSDAVLDRARELVEVALRPGPCSRAALLAALEDGGVRTDAGRGYHLLFYLALTGVLVFGPFSGKEHQIVLTDSWIPPSPARSRSDAVRELVARYVRGRGPATLADLAWWSKLPLRDLRPALAELADDAAHGAHVHEVTYADKQFWVHRDALESEGSARPRSVLLLPGFDELMLGYGDRGISVDPGFADRIVPGNNGVFKPTVVSRGRVVGLWSKSETARKVSVRIEPFEPTSSVVNRGIDAETQRLARFLDRAGAVSPPTSP